MTTLDSQLGFAVKQMIRYRDLYENQKRINKRLNLWLEGERRLIKEKGVEDLDRLLDILDEIEAEEANVTPT